MGQGGVYFLRVRAWAWPRGQAAEPGFGKLGLELGMAQGVGQAGLLSRVGWAKGGVFSQEAGPGRGPGY